MPVKRTFLVHANKNAVTFQDAEGYRNFRESLNEGDYLVTFEQYYQKRSLPQNSYLHVILTIIANHTGNKMEEVKGTLKREFATIIKPNIFTGEVQHEVQQTSKMNSYELSVFIDKVKLWALEFLNLAIPDPGDKVAIDNLLNNS